MTTSSVNSLTAHLLRMEANKKSAEALAKVLETVKKDDARQQAESIVWHEKPQKSQQLAKEKHKKFLQVALTYSNMLRVSNTFKGMAKKLKEEFKDQWSENGSKSVKCF